MAFRGLGARLRKPADRGGSENAENAVGGVPEIQRQVSSHRSLPILQRVLTRVPDTGSFGLSGDPHSTVVKSLMC
jgi:hypothetical protein